MRTVPVFLDVRERTCVVVGAGPVGTRKAAMLATSGARVRLIAPEPCAEALDLVGREPAIAFEHRAYRDGDLAGAWLAYAATGDASVQDRIARDAERERVWLNAVDEPARCSFVTPAVVSRGPIAIAIGTGGTSPALAGAIRREIDGWLGPEYEAAAGILGDLRARYAAGPGRQRAFVELLGGGLLDALRRGDRARVDALVSAACRDLSERSAAGEGA